MVDFFFFCWGPGSREVFTVQLLLVKGGNSSTSQALSKQRNKKKCERTS